MITSNNEPVWVSERPTTVVILFTVVSWLATSLFLTNDFDTDFVNMPWLPLDNFFVLLAVLAPVWGTMAFCYIFLSDTRYELYKDSLIVTKKNRADQEYNMNELISWASVDEVGRRGGISTKTVIFNFPDRKITIRSTSIPNLNKLKVALSENFAEKWVNEDNSENFYSTFISLLLVLLLFIGIPFRVTLEKQLSNEKKGIEEKFLNDAVLSSTPTFIDESGKHERSCYKMQLSLKGIKKFLFYINYIGHDKEKDILEKYLKAGDNISLSILQYDYDTKISNQREPNFWDKHFRWRHIKIKHIQSSVINL